MFLDCICSLIKCMVHVMLFLTLNVLYFNISTERPARDVDGTGRSSSSAVVKERVPLHFYSTSELSLPILV